MIPQFNRHRHQQSGYNSAFSRFCGVSAFFLQLKQKQTSFPCNKLINIDGWMHSVEKIKVTPTIFKQKDRNHHQQTKNKEAKKNSRSYGWVCSTRVLELMGCLTACIHSWWAFPSLLVLVLLLLLLFCCSLFFINYTF